MKVLIACWITSIVAMPVIAQSHINADTDFGKLATGSAQAVLACVVIALTTAIIFIGKQLLKAKDDALSGQKETSKQILEVLSDNSIALEKNSESHKEMRDAMYSLRNSVDGFAKVVETCKIKQ